MYQQAPVESEQPRTDYLAPLLQDLAVLDSRLEVAVERLRQSLPHVQDAANRGLLIEEGDVDSWLATLDTTGGSDAARQVEGENGEMPGRGGSRLAALGEMLGLEPLERAILLTALAPEVDLAYAGLYAYVQDDVTKKHATLDLVASLWCRSLAERLYARGLLAEGAPLRRHLLMAVDDSPYAHSSMLSHPLALDPRVASFLLGENNLDPALASCATLHHAVGAHAPVAHFLLPRNYLHSLQRLARAAMSVSALSTQHSALVVWMRGLEKQGKMAAAQQLAAALGRPLLVVDTPLLLNSGGEPRKVLYRALREAMLQGAPVYWTGADALAARREEGGSDLTLEIAHILGGWSGCALFDVVGLPPVALPEGPLSVELDFPAPSNEGRRALWESALNGSTRLAPDVDLALLTGAFRLTGEQIRAAAESARHSAAWRAASSGNSDEVQVNMRDLLMACRSHSNQGLGVLARKITPRYTWSDLVLPLDRTAQLREMCHHVRYGPVVFEEWGFDRKLAGGKGLNVLFAGQPGTGKTMAAEVLATDLGLDLYKIDLSSVVSKYIGETEKNLERIFREGHTSNSILFFDEADSLFGKRSQVRDSHDRYANIEISYLLQKMEEYDGIVILATNLRKNLDDAFVRRLHGSIEFPMPEELDRLEIWQRTFPPEAPVAPDVDLEFMAKRFKMSGGNIKNIILEAAFFAAEAGTSINMSHLVRATRREHQKIGKLFAESDFGEYYELLGMPQDDRELDI